MVYFTFVRFSRCGLGIDVRMARFFIFVLLAAVYGQQTPSNQELDDLIKQLFPPPTNVSNPVKGEGNTLLLPVTKSPQNRVNRASTLVPSLVADSKRVSCLTEDGKKGKCVQHYLCNSTDGTIIIDGTGLLDLRQDKGPCPSYLDTCCLVPNLLPEDKRIMPPTTLKQGCGWRNPQGVGFRIIGDVNNEAKFGEFPWMVAMMKIDEEEPSKKGDQVTVYLGGGSLIHPSVVLTAAHIVNGVDVKRLLARAGEWDTLTKNEIYANQEREVKEVTVHKDFNKGNSFYNIALLFLSAPMEMSKPHIGVVCLPPAGERATAGAICQASGWGKDKYGKGGQYKSILKRVEVPVVDRNNCQALLRNTRLGPYFELHSTFMCAGGEMGKDTCQGDGGSPLACPIQYEKDRYVQNGIVAWGLDCGQDGTPGVYVDVAYLRNWIDDKVAGHGFDLKTYTP